MNERRLDYVYHFKCEDEFDYFKKLPDVVQGNVEKYIVQVICESFVEPGDEDYITARLLAQKGMYRAFFWAAAQALEKYLKAFLLMRGASVNEKRFRGHPISELFREACSLDKKLTTVDTKFHSKIRFHPDVVESCEEIPVTEFISDVEMFGCADNRYNSFGVSFKSGYIFALDSFVFNLRQQIGVPPLEETLRKLDQGLAGALYLYNPWFADTPTNFVQIPNENFNLSLSQAVTTLDFLISENSPHGSRLALQWLDKKMFLPKKVRLYLNGT